MTATLPLALERPVTFDVRNALPSDQGYVSSTWTRSMLTLHVSDRDPAMRTWPQISAALDRVLSRPETRVLVACAPLDRRTILGWVCFASGQPAPVVHYLYARETASVSGGWVAVRGRDGLHVAPSLLARIGVTPESAVVCTSRGPSSQDMRERYPGSSYLPITEYLTPGATR